MVDLYNIVSAQLPKLNDMYLWSELESSSNTSQLLIKLFALKLQNVMSIEDLAPLFASNVGLNVLLFKTTKLLFEIKSTKCSPFASFVSLNHSFECELKSPQMTICLLLNESIIVANY